MNDPQVSLGQACAWALWTLTVLLLLSGWVAFVLHGVDMGIMLATSACVTGLGGATLSGRGYAKHISRLLRLVGGLRSIEAEKRDIRSVRERE